jgi:hypothetical protein
MRDGRFLPPYGGHGLEFHMIDPEMLESERLMTWRARDVQPELNGPMIRPGVSRILASNESPSIKREFDIRKQSRWHATCWDPERWFDQVKRPFWVSRSMRQSLSIKD